MGRPDVVSVVPANGNTRHDLPTTLRCVQSFIYPILLCNCETIAFPFTFIVSCSKFKLRGAKIKRITYCYKNRSDGKTTMV